MSAYYWTLGPVTFQNGSQVVSVAEGFRVYLTDAQAASLQGLIAPIDGPFDNPVYPLGTPTSGNLSNCIGYPANQLVGTLPNNALANSSITVAGNSVSLGGSVTRDQLTGVSSNGLVKRTGANTYAPAIAGTDFQAALQSPVFNVQTTKTANYSAAVSDFVPVSALSGGIVVALPTAPADQSRVAVKKMDPSTNTVSITVGGSDVINQSGTTTLTLVVQFQSAVLQYSAAQATWFVVSTDAPIGQLVRRLTVTVTGSTTLANAAGQDVVALVGSGGAPTLPTAVGNNNSYIVINTDTASHSVATTGGQTINGATTWTVAPGGTAEFLSDSANWRVA